MHSHTHTHVIIVKSVWKCKSGGCGSGNTTEIKLSVELWIVFICGIFHAAQVAQRMWKLSCITWQSGKAAKLYTNADAPSNMHTHASAHVHLYNWKSSEFIVFDANRQQCEQSIAKFYVLQRVFISLHLSYCRATALHMVALHMASVAICALIRKNVLVEKFFENVLYFNFSILLVLQQSFENGKYPV